MLPYTLTDRKHFTHRHHETYTAEGMKTVVEPSVHTRRDTISSSRRRWRCSGGCSRVTAGSFTGIVARHESPLPRELPQIHPTSSLALQLLTRHTLQSLRMSKHSARATYVQPVHTWFGYLRAVSVEWEYCSESSMWRYFDKWNDTRFTCIVQNHGKTSILHIKLTIQRLIKIFSYYFPCLNALRNQKYQIF